MITAKNRGSSQTYLPRLGLEYGFVDIGEKKNSMGGRSVPRPRGLLFVLVGTCIHAAEVKRQRRHVY